MNDFCNVFHGVYHQFLTFSPDKRAEKHIWNSKYISTKIKAKTLGHPWEMPSFEFQLSVTSVFDSRSNSWAKSDKSVFNSGTVSRTNLRPVGCQFGLHFATSIFFDCNSQPNLHENLHSCAVKFVGENGLWLGAKSVLKLDALLKWRKRSHKIVKIESYNLVSRFVP